MRKIALTLLFSSIFALGQELNMDKSEDAGGLTSVSQPKSNFCAEDLFLIEKCIINPINDTVQNDTIKTVDSVSYNVKLDSVRLIDKLQKPIDKNLAKAQNEDKMVEEVVKKAEKLISSTLIGKASFYGLGDGFHGRKTASGKKFNKYGLTCAVPYKSGSKSPKYPFGTKLRVTNKSNGKSVVVTVTDTGSFGSKGRVVDLSYGAFKAIEDPKKGLTNVSIERI